MQIGALTECRKVARAEANSSSQGCGVRGEPVTMLSGAGVSRLDRQRDSRHDRIRIVHRSGPETGRTDLFPQ